ncbi:MAG: exodeoxyribonuclease VII large subunit [Vulcanimicrobiaceae bacterium]
MAPEPNEIIGVSEFAKRLRAVFDRRLKKLHHIGITGELVSYAVSDQNNVNFTLKQDENTLNGFAWSADAKAFPKVAVGMVVTAIGNVTIYPVRSAYQIVCTELRPSDERGRLALQYAKLKEAYSADGLFDVARKVALPKYPLRVIVVSSGRGKGTDDFIDQMRDEAPFVQVTLQETQVQGQGAELSIARAIAAADAVAPDIIVVLRGGGAYEELFTFNLDPVVRAIAAASTPIVTSIGHNADRHLADDVADAYFATPTAAIKTIVASWVDGVRRMREAGRRMEKTVRNDVRMRAQRLDGMQSKLRGASRFGLDVLKERLRAHSVRLEQCSPSTRLRQRRAAYAQIIGRLGAWPPHALIHFDRGLQASVQRLQTANDSVVSQRVVRYDRWRALLTALDPAAPLVRGYAIVEIDGHPLLRADAVKIGDAVRARLAHGALALRVEEVLP